MLVGYCRVSSSSQSLDVQVEALQAAGVEKIFAEKMSGTRASDRIELQRCIEFVREGDVLAVHRLDRFARSQADLHSLIQIITHKNVGFRCLNQPALDTTTSMGQLVLGILGAVAQFETELRAERQREGIAKAKAAGVYTGRKRSIDRDRIATLRNEGKGAAEIARIMNIGRASVYRCLGAAIAA